MAWIRWRGNGAGRRARIGYRDRRTGKIAFKDGGAADAPAAEALRARIERERERPPSGDATTSVAVVFEAWLEDLRVRGRVGETAQYYRGKLGVLVRENEARPVGEITVALVEAYVRRPRNPPARAMSASTKRRVLGSVSTWLAWCVERRYEVDPALPARIRRVETERPRMNDREALTPRQVGQLLEAAAGTALEAPVALAGLAGLPIGDIRTLTWGEVDLAAGTMRRRRGRRKTGLAYRVALSARVVEALSRLPRGASGDLVVSLKAGGVLARNLRDLYAKAGVPRETGDLWHRLRHAFGTGLSASGADVATIGAAMGHAPGSPITLRYVHPEERRVRAAVEALDESSRQDRGRGAPS